MIDTKSKFRVIITDKKSAKENMAIDEALLKNYNQGDYAILRLYTWEDDSITIGISQDFITYPFIKNPNKNAAKRITGGGILFHGHDVSYSIIIPSEILKGLSIKKSYEKICQFILNFYKNLGLYVCYAKDDENIQLSKSEFCQIGFEAYDILINSKKIGGNAQRRTKKAIFQHGSIPVFKTNDKEMFGNSLEDMKIDINFEETIKGLIDSFKQCFNVEIELSQLTKDEEETKSSLLKDKYDYSRN